MKLQISQFKFVLAVLLVVNISAEKFSYDGYKLLRLYPTTLKQFELLREFETNDPNFDIWAYLSGKSMDVLLSPTAFSSYSMFFAEKNIRFEVLRDNIQELIDREERSMAMSRNRNSIVYRYARYNEINNFLETVADDNQDIVKIYDAGRTLQNRVIKVLAIKTPTATRSLWIDCGIHAREWVAPATCIYTIDKLLYEYRNGNPETVEILNKYEVHIMPLVNPDGYEYSHTTTRLWRKNLSINQGSRCNGTDLNRNFGFQWGTNGGSSTNPCSETFAGKGPESELEVQSVIKAINAKAGEWDAFLTIHSYGQLWLVPFGYSLTEKPVGDAEIRLAAQIGANAIKDYNGTIFQVGSSAEILYIGSGSSRDWASGAAGIKYSSTLELRPPQSGPDSSFGFVWPEDRLPVVVEETYEGMKAFFKHISENP